MQNQDSRFFLTCLLLTALCCLYSAWTLYAVIQDRPLDFYLYYMAAYGFSHNRDVYEMGGDQTDVHSQDWAELARETGVPKYSTPYRYPPLTAFLVWPLTLLPPPLAAVLWLALSAGAFAASAWLLGATGKGPFAIPLALGLLLFFVPPLTTLDTGQVNGFLLLSLAVAFHAASRNSKRIAGVAVAVGTLLKLIPAAFIGHFALRRQWKALAFSCLSVVLLFGLTLPLIGWQGVRSYAENFLAIGQPGDLFPRGANQAFSGFFARFCSPDSGGWRLGSNPALAELLWKTCSLGLVVATALLCRPAGPFSRLFDLEFALVTVAINLITPYAWYHQFVLLLIPFFVLVRRALDDPALRWMLYPLAIGYLATDVHGLIWKRLAFNPLLVSMPFYTALMLWGFLAWLLLKQKGAPIPFHKTIPSV